MSNFRSRSMFLFALAGLLLSPQGLVAQDVHIAYPTAGTTLTPGQKLNIILNFTTTTSSVNQIGFSTGLRTTSKSDNSSLGRPYLGTVSLLPGSNNVSYDAAKSQYNYNVTLPPAADFLDGFSAPYELTVANYYLLGATFSPIVKLTAVQVTIANSTAPGNGNSTAPGGNPGNIGNNGTPNGPPPSGNANNLERPGLALLSVLGLCSLALFA